MQKAQDGDIFVRIAGMIAIISLISTIVTASFSYRNDLVSAMPDRNAHQRAGINSLSMSQQSLDDMEMPGRAQKTRQFTHPPCPKSPPRSHHGQRVACVIRRNSICCGSFANSEIIMKYDALLVVMVAGCANFSVFLFRPSITSELPDLALAALWFVAVFLVVYGLMRVFRRKRRT